MADNESGLHIKATVKMQNIREKSQEYLNFSTDILKWKIYKPFPAYSVPEKKSEYLIISSTFLAQNRFRIFKKFNV